MLVFSTAVGVAATVVTVSTAVMVVGDNLSGGMSPILAGPAFEEKVVVVGRVVIIDAPHMG